MVTRLLVLLNNASRADGMINKRSTIIVGFMLKLEIRDSAVQLAINIKKVTNVLAASTRRSISLS